MRFLSINRAFIMRNYTVIHKRRYDKVKHYCNKCSTEKLKEIIQKYSIPHPINMNFDFTQAKKDACTLTLQHYLETLTLNEKNSKKDDTNNDNKVKPTVKPMTKKTIKLKEKVTTRVNKKETAKKDEHIRVEFICKTINNPENEYEQQLSQELRTSYTQTFGKEIESIQQAGNNRDHYDFMIKHTDGSVHRCEEKGSEKSKEINEEDVPWKNSVQVLNGVGSKFETGRMYAKLYYDTFIATNKLSEYVDTELPQPSSYEEWLKRDAFACGDPKTTYGKEFKSAFRMKYGKGTSFTGLKGTPDAIRPVINKLFEDQWNNNPKHKEVSIQELQDKLNAIFDEKDCYLQTTGTIDDKNITFMWKKKIEAPVIKDITLDIQKDIYFNIESDSGHTFKSILRWGKGCGFSNIRFDVR